MAKNIVPLPQPMRSKINVTVLKSDLFVGMSASVVICQSNYFGFGFTTLNPLGANTDNKRLYSQAKENTDTRNENA